MSARSLSTELRGGVLYVTFDTPACPVNIFSHATAVELLAILEGIEDERRGQRGDPGVRALVFRSGKADSFVNGASLMLASAVSSEQDLPRLTATIRRAYKAIGDLTIPTIAAIRGNCFGCGVEFSLRFRYRVAADAFDTQFYMTEIADYLLVPTFGSTQILPHVLGVREATSFLVWGERWSARQALAKGLLAACYADAEFDASVERFAEEVASGAGPERRPDVRDAPADVEAFARETRARIAGLPPAYRGVYETCFRLIEGAALRPALGAEHFEEEVRESGRSIMNPMSKAAVSLFFVRQLGDQVCLRGARERSEFRVRCDGEGAAFLRREIEGRRVRGVTFGPGPAGEAIVFDSYSRADAEPTLPRHEPGGGRIAVAVALQPDPPALDGQVVLYAPSWRHGLPFAEIACERSGDDAQRVYQLLAKAGVPAIITCPKGSFVLNDLLRAYLGPQLAFLARGGSRGDLAATLVGFGFTRLAGDWLPGWDLDALAAVCSAGGAGCDAPALGALPTSAEASGGRPVPALEAAVLGSLLACALRNLEARAAAHPSIVDVAAREVLDFPLGYGSLCRVASVARARALFEHEPDLASLVLPESLASLRRYAENGRDFYR